MKNTHVTIGRTRRIKADVYGRSITIEGEVQGNLFGEERIVLQPSGVVHGDMKAPAINLEEGAKFKGNIDMEAWDEKQSTLKEVPLARDRNVPSKT
ncbi:MAG: polymer-forming cytoskeletal protein [Acidobacteria bacterium]|nr:polymer-forming cytoskeletal protein [Acidobacteriota bacterium]